MHGRQSPGAWGLRGKAAEALEEENAKLKRLLAEAKLDKAVLRDLLTKK